jgi:hypothetical protein
MGRLKRCVIVMVVAGPWQVAVLQLLKSVSTLKPISPLAVGGLGGLEQVDWTEVDSSCPFLPTSQALWLGSGCWLARHSGE